MKHLSCHKTSRHPKLTFCMTYRGLSFCLVVIIIYDRSLILPLSIELTPRTSDLYISEVTAQKSDYRIRTLRHVFPLFSVHFRDLVDSLLGVDV